MSANGLAFVFPGQGSQRRGMGRDFHDAFAESRAVFDEVSTALGLDVAALCFDDEERLGHTEFQQPAILTVEIAMLAPDLGRQLLAKKGPYLGLKGPLVVREIEVHVCNVLCQHACGL